MTGDELLEQATQLIATIDTEDMATLASQKAHMAALKKVWSDDGDKKGWTKVLD